MGCHTWFYTKSELPTEELKSFLIEKVVNDNLTDEDKEFLKSYPEYGNKNQAKYELLVFRKQKQDIESGSMSVKDMADIYCLYFICFEVEPEYCRTAKNLLNGVSVSLF